MSSKQITKESRRQQGKPLVVAPQRESPSGAPGGAPGGTASGTIDAIIHEFPSGRPKFTLEMPQVLDKSSALNEYTDRNSMLYTYHHMRQGEQKSLASLANWDQVLEEAKE